MTDLPRLRTTTCTHNKTRGFRCVSARNPPSAFLSKSRGNGTLGCVRDPRTSAHVFPEAQRGRMDPPDPKTLYTRPVHLSQVSKSGVGLPSACKSVWLPVERHSQTVTPAGTMSARRHYLPPDIQPLRPSGPSAPHQHREGLPSADPAHRQVPQRSCI